MNLGNVIRNKTFNHLVLATPYTLRLWKGKYVTSWPEVFMPRTQVSHVCKHTHTHTLALHNWWKRTRKEMNMNV